ncbi:hypothetical protein D3C86_1939840 [compost metagenome]
MGSVTTVRGELGAMAVITVGLSSDSSWMCSSAGCAATGLSRLPHTRARVPCKTGRLDKVDIRHSSNRSIKNTRRRLRLIYAAHASGA